MALALYRKYRPQKFADVAEQQHVVRTITNALKNGATAHAYLFSGPRGIGKTTIARLLAKALNCEQRPAGEAEPCGECPSCKEFQEGRYIDIVEIDAASQTKVEETRENIIENVRFAPTRGKYKVFIIDEVHMLSASSFNALLKTLEEPPAHVVFILATTELHKIPATILSRCQRFDFTRIPAPEMIVRLEKLATAEGVTVTPGVLSQIARLSEGCLRDAESLLGQLIGLGEREITEDHASLVLPQSHVAEVADMVSLTVDGDVPGLLERIATLAETGASMKHLFDEVMEYVRDGVWIGSGAAPRDELDPQTVARLRDLLTRASASRLLELLDRLLAARTLSAPGALPQLPLESALIGFALAKSAPIAAAPIPAPKAPASTSVPSAAVSTPPTPPAPSHLPPLEDVKGKWGRIGSAIGEKNVALPLILQAATPARYDGQTLVVECAYEFHAKAMTETKNLRLFLDACKEVLMTDFENVHFVFTPKSQESGSLEDIAKAFGGAIL